MLYLLIRNVLFLFNREVSLYVALINIINHVRSEDQLSKVNFITNSNMLLVHLFFIIYFIINILFINP